MGIQTRTYLKGKFETGDKPTQQDFYDLLDSYIHSTDDPSKTLPAVSGQSGKILKTDGTNIAWSAESPFPEAPVNGKQYARKDSAWSEVTGKKVYKLDANTTGYGSPVMTYSSVTQSALFAITANNGEWGEAADTPQYKYWWYGGSWQYMEASQFGLMPYVVGDNGEDEVRLIVNQTGAPAFIVFPGGWDGVSGSIPLTFDRTAWLNTLGMDFPYVIDTSRGRGAWITAEDWTVGSRRYITPMAHLTNSGGAGWFFNYKTHIGFEFYPSGWQQNAPNTWGRYAWGIEDGMGLLFGENNSGDGQGDGWGNEPSLNHLGEMKRYTLSEDQFNNLGTGTIVGVLNDLTNVDANPLDGEYLVWNAGLGQWVAGTIMMPQPLTHITDMDMGDIYNILAITPTSTSNYVYTNGKLMSYDEVRNGTTYHIANTYDVNGRLSYSTIIGGAIVMYGTTYSYDVNGNLTGTILALD